MVSSDVSPMYFNEFSSSDPDMLIRLIDLVFVLCLTD